MVGDAEVFESDIHGSSGHLLERVLAVAGGGVVVKGAAQVFVPFHAKYSKCIFPVLADNFADLDCSVMRFLSPSS